MAFIHRSWMQDLTVPPGGDLSADWQPLIKEISSSLEIQNSFFATIMSFFTLKVSHRNEPLIPQSRRLRIQPALGITYSMLYTRLNNSTESINGPAAPFSASVQMSAKRPALALETVEHYIELIECSDDKIFLDFATLEALNEVYKHVDGTNDFYIITSHEGCDLEGERNVRRYVCNRKPNDVRILNFQGCLL